MSEYSRSPEDLSGIRETAEQFGFCIVRNLFSAQEMHGIESRMAQVSEIGGTVLDLMGREDFRPLLLDPRILGIARALLGEALVYYAETALNFEPTPGAITGNPFRVLHADARGTPQDLDATWNQDRGRVYRGYRFGIYCRDYRRHGGGLKVAPGSHLGDAADYEVSTRRFGGVARHRIRLGAGEVLKLPMPDFDLYNVPSEPGDLVIFNLRTFHSAGALRLRQRPTLALLPQVEEDLLRSRPELFIGNPPGARNTIFFDYAAPCEEIDLYIKWRAWRIFQMSQGKQPLSATQKNDIAAAYRLDGDAARRDAAAVGVQLRCDKAIAAVADAGDSVALHERLERMIALHREFSPHHSLFGPGTGAYSRARLPQLGST